MADELALVRTSTGRCYRKSRPSRRRWIANSLQNEVLWNRQEGGAALAKTDAYLLENPDYRADHAQALQTIAMHSGARQLAAGARTRACRHGCAPEVASYFPHCRVQF